MSVPRPVCFMVMPYGKKMTNAQPAQGLAEVDFDTLWDKALRPAIEKLGYEPVRADQDIGALIIHEMLERLYFSDLILAEMTIPNGNVYYEVGIRHACRNSGCVMLAADWSKQLFDVVQMRTVRYPMTLTTVDDAAAAAICEKLVQAIPALIAGSSPVYMALPGYPITVDPQRATVMRQRLDVLSKFQARISAIRSAPSESREAMIDTVLNDYGSTVPMLPSVGHGLLKLFESVGSWHRILTVLPSLPIEVAESPDTVELVNLAKSKLGDHMQAIVGLLALIQCSGATSEREGLIGGRYRKLFNESSGEEKRSHLNNAIKHYERGMLLDLNDYYPSSNLPRLYRERGNKDDEEKAQAVAQVVFYACQRARERKSTDDWLKPTLLGSAFDTGNVEQAQSLCSEIEQEGPEPWHLDTTITALELSLLHVSDATKRAALCEILDRIRQLNKCDS